ncbi:MAG: carboxypeptidase-like regulatory domain-containing protein, partial [Flavisolibacter sp.]
MKKTISSLFVLLVLYGQVVFGQGLVRGTVRDEKGPLQGVSVLVKHAARGAQTDASGNFSIQANIGDTLRFTYSGYASQESVVDGRNGYTIIMNVDAKSLDDVVVVGYGTKKKQFLTGAVSSVGSEVLQSKPITNAFAALQGEIPGTFIQRYSGQPGAEDFNLNVRGPSSKNGAGSPL